MVKTTLNLDERALREAKELSGARTKTETVNEALRRFVHELRQKKLLARRGKPEAEVDEDALRTRR
ncbi:MAG: type II toxin-antitoxin system VapB family antitoxin [Thermoanaerobaculia bacterium]